MRAHDTRAFMALMAIAQHHGRPHTPTDQAWIESFFGHIKGEWPHLEDIADPVVLEAELARVRLEYNTVRHEGIGYVTPDDEHYGRGEDIREARRQGLARARARRAARLPSPDREQRRRGDLMTWFISNRVSAVKSDSRVTHIVGGSVDLSGRRTRSPRESRARLSIERQSPL